MQHLLVIWKCSFLFDVIRGGIAHLDDIFVIVHYHRVQVLVSTTQEDILFFLIQNNFRWVGNECDMIEDVGLYIDSNCE